MTRYLCRPHVEACPACDQIDQVRRTGSTPNVDAWACDGCGTAWAISLVKLHLLRDRAGDYAEQFGAARWILRQVVQLAEEMPKLTDTELQDRLLALAGSCAR